MGSSGAASGGPPSGAAGGDLGGNYPAPAVAGFQGRPVSNAAPNNGDSMVWNGALWVPTAIASPGPATTVTGPDAFGAAAVVGVSALYSRGDHNHGLPANPAPAFAVPAVVLGTAAAAGVASTVIRSDSTVVAFDVTAPVTQAFGDAAATGAAAIAARRDHKHGMPANPAPSPATTVTGPDAFGAAAAVGASSNYARQDHDHGLPAAPSAGHALLSGFLFGSATNTAIASTQMSRVLPTTGLGASLGVVSVAMVRAGAITGISVTESLGTMAAGTTRTYTVFVNGSATAVTVTASSTGSGTFSVEATGNVAVAAGDLVDVRIAINQGFGGGTLRCEATVELAV